jgi:hypothetical protein
MDRFNVQYYVTNDTHDIDGQGLQRLATEDVHLDDIRALCARYALAANLFTAQGFHYGGVMHGTVVSVYAPWGPIDPGLLVIQPPDWGSRCTKVRKVS